MSQSGSFKKQMAVKVAQSSYTFMLKCPILYQKYKKEKEKKISISKDNFSIFNSCKGVTFSMTHQFELDQGCAYVVLCGVLTGDWASAFRLSTTLLQSADHFPFLNKPGIGRLYPPHKLQSGSSRTEVNISVLCRAEAVVSCTLHTCAVKSPVSYLGNKDLLRFSLCFMFSITNSLWNVSDPGTHSPDSSDQEPVN